MRALGFFAATAIAASLVLAAPGAASTETNLLFILDGSNSMWGKVEGQTKIESAQTVLINLLADLPMDTNVGLMVYGHTSKYSCDDIELMSPLGADTLQALGAKIKGVQPMGKTPIAGALFGSTIAFRGKEGDNNHVVLISDGLETCGGDPCMAASALASANIQPRVHVIGFDVNAQEQAQLQCISRLGNGQYFSAANAQELKVAVAQVAQVVEKVPEPKKEPEEIFRDDFDGEELADHWELLNPNPDAFIVEDGQLLIVSGTPGSMPAETVENFFRLSEPLPEGNWMVTVKFTVEFQTAQERPFLSLYQDAENYIEVLASAYYPYGMMPAPHVVLEAYKVLKGQKKTFAKQIWVGSGGGSYDELILQPILLRLTKEKRSFVASAMFEGAEEPAWVELDSFTVLKAKGSFAVGIYQATDTPGESTMSIDWVKIEVPGEE